MGKKCADSTVFDQKRAKKREKLKIRSFHDGQSKGSWDNFKRRFDIKMQKNGRENTFEILKAVPSEKAKDVSFCK